MSSYKFNYEAVPDKTAAAEVANAFISFMLATDVGINQKRYNQLPDWAKKYWKAVS